MSKQNGKSQSSGQDCLNRKIVERRFGTEMHPGEQHWKSVLSSLSLWNGPRTAQGVQKEVCARSFVLALYSVGRLPDCGRMFAATRIAALQAARSRPLP